LSARRRQEVVERAVYAKRHLNRHRRR
jgi:hypothetical protein